MSATPMVSPDGNWWWDGQRWQPMPQRVAPAAAPAPATAPAPAPAAAPAPADGRPSWLPAETPAPQVLQRGTIPAGMSTPILATPPRAARGPRGGVSTPTAGVLVLVVLVALGTAGVYILTRPHGAAAGAASTPAAGTVATPPGAAAPAAGSVKVCGQIPAVPGKQLPCWSGNLVLSGELAASAAFQSITAINVYGSCRDFAASGGARNSLTIPPVVPTDVAGHKVSVHGQVQSYHGPGSYALKDIGLLSVQVDDLSYRASPSRPGDSGTMSMAADGSGGLTFAASRYDNRDITESRPLGQLSARISWHCNELA